MAQETWPPVGDAVWTLFEGAPAPGPDATPWVQPNQYQGAFLDPAAMRGLLALAPAEGTDDAANAPLQMSLPNPDGGFSRFRVVESPIMEPGLAAQFPEIKTYLGQGVDDPAATVRFDLTPLGFHAQVLTPNGAWYIDPYFKNDVVQYTSFYKRDLTNIHAAEWLCHVPDAADSARETFGSNLSTRAAVVRKQYRLANACTGEYAAKFGGTQAGAQAAIVTAINRVTGVYETEVGVRMVLVANNTNVVYTNSSTDPYTNNDGGAMLGQNITTCNAQIGSGNYDIGHVFSTGGGGVAYLGVVCTSSKAGGVTGLSNPTGDAFYIDYVAHEMGHQFGGNHTFNGTSGSCAGGNRNASTAYEIGSATTIMGYAGICGVDDIQAHSDPYFSFISIQEISSFINTGSGNNCDAPTTTSNNTPTVNAGATTFTIPQQTPFALTPTSYSDPDGNALTFSWEERDLGAAQAATAADNGAAPLFRTFIPSTSPTRLVPQLSNILSNTLTKGEKWAQTNRSVKWRLTVRDNVAGNGGTAFSDRTVTVTTSAGPFTVNTANTATAWNAGSTQTITWSVANTNIAPVNCATVNILFSTDNGSTFPYILASGTANDGTENVVLPGVATTNGRIKVEAVGNIFFDINNAKVTLNNAPPNTPTNVAASPSNPCAGQTVQLTATVGSGEVVDWYNVSCGTGLIGTGSPLAVVANSNTTYYAKARRTSDGATSSACGSASITITPLPTAPTTASVDRTGFCKGDDGSITLTASGGSGTTLRWFSDSCGGTQVGTGSPLVINSPTATTTYYARWENACGQSTCAAVVVIVSGADFDGSGFLDFDDYIAFVQAFEAGDQSADFDGSGFVDFDDFTAFVEAFELGC